MSVTSDAPHSASHPARLRAEPLRSQDTSAAVELLARRALGIAINALSDGGRVTALAPHEPWLVDGARALLTRRVPDGPERALALDVLEAATAT